MKILVIDDEDSVREAYRHVFDFHDSAPTNSVAASLADELFASSAPSPTPRARTEPFAVSYAAQGIDGVRLAEEALARGNPFKVAFIDIRMPPGIDGKETARRIRQIDPGINLVIVSGYSDHSVTDIAAVAGPPDKIFYICKPFAAEEIRHMARALSARWDHDTAQVAVLRQKVAELQASEARANHMANHDFLTGAPNRMAFQQELVDRLADQRGRLAVAFLDLDRFKQVNDTLGHAAGDELLGTVYATLCANAPGKAMVARLGGDEFGILFDASTREEAQEIGQRLVDACSGTFSVFENSVHIGASCGIVDCWGHPEKGANDLLRYADLALFAAKRGDGGRVRLFDEQLDASQQFRQRIEAGLYQAIGKGELALHYQPIVERQSLAVIGYEALLRWTSATYGNIPPGVFIPIAEESPVIQDLGDWVVERAFADAGAWPDKLISINFSPKQFKRPDFADRLVSAAARAGIAPSRVQIEITETALFDDVDHVRATLEQVRSHGFLVALDDFGTGYSSMFNLKSFSIDCIKIDRSFVEGMGMDNQSAAIVNAISHLARGLGLKIVAEGVETETQCQALRLIGCSHMQGFLFGTAQMAHTIENDPDRNPATASPGQLAAG